ncbi:LSU ribosomal protein L1p (L10Ae) [invertebrate metagenome]|uniref:LSU ribosomal protein L1p (L10Ae) n=1 Tax=invertebrate metagenome TaxID=1711999 RepID=A0A484HB47_9ZZZZ
MTKGKRLREAYAAVDRTRFYDLHEALQVVRTQANAKFDETIELSMNLGVDPRHADQMVRGVVTLPHGTGKSVRVAVFARGDKAKEAELAGVDIVGAEDLAGRVRAGQIDFNRCIATPDMMGILGKLGKVLGPRNLMPNPKLGTVTVNVSEAIRAAKSGQVQFRVDKAGIIHACVGKVSFSDHALVDNIRVFCEAIIKAKPSGAKGVYLKKVSVSSTMGPGVKVNVSNLAGG